MKTSKCCSAKAITLGLFLLVAVGAARADIGTNNILDNAYSAYTTVAATWASKIKSHASSLFWTLALISMIWTFGIMAIRKADIAEFFSEFIKFTLFIGIFWWFLDNGPMLATSIIDSMQKLGAEASAGTSTSSVPLPSPSGIVDIGFHLLDVVREKSSVWSPLISIIGFIISLIILIILALVAVNMLILLISAWIMAYAGIFFLGFGGSRWTSDMAISYFKNVLAVATQIFTMVLIIGIGKGFIEEFYSHMSSDYKLTEMAAVLVAALILLVLVNKLPALMGGMATGGGVGALGNGFGAAHAAAAIQLAAAAISTAASAMTSLVANGIGTGSSLNEAFKKSRDFENSVEGQRDFMQSQSQSHSGFDQGDPGPGGGGRGYCESEPSAPRHQGGESTGGDAQTKSSSPSSSKNSAAGTASHQSAGTASKGARAARIAVGTLGVIGGGAYTVAKDTIMDRAGDSIMGRLAQTIKASAESESAEWDSQTASRNSLSPGSEEKFDPAAEIAAFRDRKPYEEGNDDGDHVS